MPYEVIGLECKMTVSIHEYSTVVNNTSVQIEKMYISVYYIPELVAYLTNCRFQFCFIIHTCIVYCTLHTVCGKKKYRNTLYIN